MTALLLSLLLWIWDNRSFNAISRGNKAKIEGQQSYQKADYLGAAVAYREVLAVSLFAEPEARFNLAHSYFKLNQFQNAQGLYGRLALVKNPKIASQAQTQLGVIYAIEKDTLKALNALKKSLMINPENRLAAYNYELLKKQYRGSMPKTQENKPEPEEKPTPATTTPQQALEAQRSEEKKNFLNRLAAMNMTEAQALFILDALKASEIQYSQQHKRKNSADNRGKW